MKQKEYDELQARFDVLEVQLRNICNLVAKMRRTADKQGQWVSMGVDPYKALMAAEQQGPLVTELYERVDEARKIVRKV